MGGFLGIGGSAVKTDRKQQLGGYGDLNNVFNYGLDTSKRQQTAGNDALDQATDYYAKLTSGDRGAVTSAVAPETNVIAAQGDSQRKQLASSGTARGGGTNAVLQASEGAERGAQQNVVDQARPQAASAEARIGALRLSDAMSALGIGGSAAQDITADASGSRKTSNEINQQTQEQVGQLAGLLLGL